MPHGFVGTLDFWCFSTVKPCAESPTDSKGGSFWFPRQVAHPKKVDFRGGFFNIIGGYRIFTKINMSNLSQVIGWLILGVEGWRTNPSFLNGPGAWVNGCDVWNVYKYIFIPIFGTYIDYIVSCIYECMLCIYDIYIHIQIIYMIILIQLIGARCLLISSRFSMHFVVNASRRSFSCTCCPQENDHKVGGVLRSTTWLI